MGARGGIGRRVRFRSVWTMSVRVQIPPRPLFYCVIFGIIKFMKKITKNEEETYNFGKEWAQNLQGGEVIGLLGSLGAGKTVFVKGLADGLGCKENINSPTFVIMKVHKIKNNKNIKTLCHIDTYRTESKEDLQDIGAEEYFDQQDVVTVIEWAGKVKNILPESTKIVKIIIQNGKREINY